MRATRQAHTHTLARVELTVDGDGQSLFGTREIFAQTIQDAK